MKPPRKWTELSDVFIFKEHAHAKLNYSFAEFVEVPATTSSTDPLCDSCVMSFPLNYIFDVNLVASGNSTIDMLRLQFKSLQDMMANEARMFLGKVSLPSNTVNSTDDCHNNLGSQLMSSYSFEKLKTVISLMESGSVLKLYLQGEGMPSLDLHLHNFVSRNVHISNPDFVHDDVVLQHRHLKETYFYSKNSSVARSFPDNNFNPIESKSSKESESISDFAVLDLDRMLFEILQVRDRRTHLLHTLQKRMLLCPPLEEEPMMKPDQLRTENLEKDILSLKNAIKCSAERISGVREQIGALKSYWQDSESLCESKEREAHILLNVLRWRQKELVSDVQEIFFITKRREESNERKAKVTKLRGMRHLVIMSLEVERTVRKIGSKLWKHTHTTPKLSEEMSQTSENAEVFKSEATGTGESSNTSELIPFPSHSWVWEPWAGLALVAHLLLMLSKYYDLPLRILPNELSDVYPVPSELQDLVVSPHAPVLPSKSPMQLLGSGIFNGNLKLPFKLSNKAPEDAASGRQETKHVLPSFAETDPCVANLSAVQKYLRKLSGIRNEEQEQCTSLLQTATFWDGTYPTNSPGSSFLASSRSIFGSNPVSVSADDTAAIRDWQILGPDCGDLPVSQQRRILGRITHLHNMTADLASYFYMHVSKSPRRFFLSQKPGDLADLTLPIFESLSCLMEEEADAVRAASPRRRPDL